ncbi:MAG: hypothetical protein AAF399_24645 [Bacteroidota bacterium]
MFGASDEVLGSIESGVDFERRIGEIYQRCRTDEEISQSFDELQQELEEQIETRMKQTRKQLLENFDMDVVHRLKVTLDNTKQYVGRYEKMLFDFTRYAMAGTSDIHFQDGYQFVLRNNPFPSKAIPIGVYHIRPGKKEQAHKYRLQHPLAQALLTQNREQTLPLATVRFDHSAFAGNFASLQPLIGQEGWLQLHLLTVDSFETSDHLLFVGVSQKGKRMSAEQCERLFELPGEVLTIHPAGSQSPANLGELAQRAKSKKLQQLAAKDQEYFLHETTKLNKWADDRVLAAEQELKDTKKQIKELNRQSRQEKDPSALLGIQKKLRDLQKKQRKQRQEIFSVEEEIEDQRDQMIEEIEARMKRETEEKILFHIRWMLV